MIVDDLVAAKSYMGYLKDDNDLTALHVAGNVGVIVKLLCGIFEMKRIEIYYTLR